MFLKGHPNDNDDVFGGSDDDSGNDDFADGGIQDFFAGDQAPADDIPTGGFAPVGVDGSEESGRIGVVGGMEPFDPLQAPNERDFVLAMDAGDKSKCSITSTLHSWRTGQVQNIGS